MRTIKRISKFNFKDLFVFEMANNHQGDIEHGKRIIREFAGVAKEFGIRAAIKLQFRELDTFIHPAHKRSASNKHIPRFEQTRLSEEQFAELVAEIKSNGLISMATPFDELSVDILERLDVEVIKIGSCSASDRPLLERVSKSGKPVICSVGGLPLADDDIAYRDKEGMVNVDWLNTFFRKRSVDFALMYCVSIYPMPVEYANLQKIARMKLRYPDLTVGFSTHESPDNTSFIGLAYAMGARMFEKHVGIATDTIKLNAYSATPEQVRSWLKAYKEARAACGSGGDIFCAQEIQDLRSLMRGTYFSRAIKKGNLIKRSDVFFAIPIGNDQMPSGIFAEGLVADRDYAEGEALPMSLAERKSSHRDIIFNAINTVIGMVNEAKVAIGEDINVELSHHYGLDRFSEIGCILIEYIKDEEYGLKIIAQLPGQWNPEHYHKKKKETFRILHGELKVWIEGKEFIRRSGETITIHRGKGHSFGTETGCIFEEISTKDWPNDSYYKDPEIAKLPRDSRKTYLQNWGRYQFD